LVKKTIYSDAYYVEFVYKCIVYFVNCKWIILLLEF